MTRQPLVLAQTADGVARLTLNRPGKRNALNAAMVEALHQDLDRLADDSGARVVALGGAGADFCAGADLAEVAESQTRGPETGLAAAQRIGDLFVAIRRLPKPVVAVVHGRAFGGGCGLASACDLVLAHEDARFGYPEVHLGFVPAMVMAVLRRKTGESTAFELAVGGRPIGADEAVSAGLANHVLPAAAFESAVRDYLSDLAERPPGAVALTKRLLYGLDGASFEDAVARGAEVNALARLADECRDGVNRFLKG